MTTKSTTNEPLRIVFLGDSITGHSNLASYLKFSHIVERMVRAKLGDRGVVSFNRGIGGDRTAGVIARLDRDCIDLHPDIVVLLISGNDAGDPNADRAEIRRNLDTIVSRIVATGAKLLVLQYHIVPNPARPETAWQHLVSTNDLIADVAAAHNVPVLPMGPPMTAAANKQPTVELANEIDGVHLNPGGELVFADTIFDKLKSLSWI
ncbi:MAG TPA: SGNH/GDSL hydrolase family protein [Capsulimonadaceae bacterium]|jgi:lysophospholipase L1-like esterase